MRQTKSDAFCYHRPMIRTRDLLIFVAVLFFLGVGIAVTLLLEHGMSFSTTGSFSFDPSSVASTTYSAETSNRSKNRDDIITRLRNALALNPSEVEPSPSVEEGEAEEIPDEGESVADGIQRCSTADDALVYSQSWPLTGVALTTSGGMRNVVLTSLPNTESVDVNASTTASTSVSTPATKVLISFPQTPYGTVNPQCVPSEVVGVTTSGSLMFNSDASFYRGYGQDYLIGYARDGFPIYGYYDGPVDSCGGYMHQTGYRYTVSPDRDHIIGCFTAPVSSFAL